MGSRPRRRLRSWSWARNWRTRIGDRLEPESRKHVVDQVGALHVIDQSLSRKAGRTSCLMRSGETRPPDLAPSLSPPSSVASVVSRHRRPFRPALFVLPRLCSCAFACVSTTYLLHPRLFSFSSALCVSTHIIPSKIFSCAGALVPLGGH
jgi:hypothetical protein